MKNRDDIHDIGGPKKHGNSVKNSFLRISIVIPDIISKNDNIIMSAIGLIL